MKNKNNENTIIDVFNKNYIQYTTCTREFTSITGAQWPKTTNIWSGPMKIYRHEFSWLLKFEYFM